MRNRYLLILIVAAIFQIAGVKAQSGLDVRTFPWGAIDQQKVSMDIAFNGWVYQTFSIRNGFALVMSKDNGDTWITVDSVILSGYTFTPRIVVAGNDTNSLRVYMVVNRSENSINDSRLYLNTYNGRTGAFISNQGIDYYTDVTRSFDIVTDYKAPAVLSAPYSIAVLYVRGAGADSLLLQVSTDSGSTFATREVVTTSNKFIENVSLAYGISNSWSLGRLFMAWQVYSNPSSATASLYTTYTDAINGWAYVPVNLDSLDPSMLGQVRNPHIAASQSTSADNDSGNITVLIVVERQTTGAAFSNIMGFQNMSAVGGNTWIVKPIENDLDNTIQPDIVYEATNKQFYITYYDSTLKQMPCIQNNINLDDYLGIWNYVTSNIVDDSTKLTNPWPTVRINPYFAWPAWGWTNTYNSIGQSMFDAEYRQKAPVIFSLSPDTVFVGSDSLTININGASFTLYTLVTVGPDTVLYNVQTTGLMTAVIPAALLTAPGILPVNVITIADYGGGGPSNTASFHVITASEINDLGGRNTIMVYPNPANNQLNISYAFTEAGKMQINMYDINGRLVKEISDMNCASGNGQTTANVSELATGLYQLVISTDKGTIARKISIIR